MTENELIAMRDEMMVIVGDQYATERERREGISTAVLIDIALTLRRIVEAMDRL